jgi:hypothetical protein
MNIDRFMIAFSCENGHVIHSSKCAHGATKNLFGVPIDRTGVSFPYSLRQGRAIRQVYHIMLYLGSVRQLRDSYLLISASSGHLLPAPPERSVPGMACLLSLRKEVCGSGEPLAPSLTIALFTAENPVTGGR